MLVVKFPFPSLVIEIKALPSTARFTCSFAAKPVPLRFTWLLSAPETGLMDRLAPPTFAAPVRVKVVASVKWLVCPEATT
jgi:hypothetical protein